MGQSTNGFEFFQGHHITAPVPVDTRIIVDTVAHLTDNNYWEKNGAFLYKGLLVTVTEDTESNNGAYYISKLGANPSTTVWVKLGVNADLVSHATNTSNPHQVTKAQVGLGSVTNDPQVKRVEMGAADGVATLDSNKHVLDSQLGVEVHNVVEVYATYDLVNGAPTNIKLFEDSAHNTEVATPVKNRLYVDITSGSSMQFIWTGSGKNYKAVGSPVVLGEDSNSAYPGNKGKDLADNFNSHQGNTSNPHHVTKDQVGLGNVTNDSQVKRAEMGKANGVATLDGSTKIPSAQLPDLPPLIADKNLVTPVINPIWNIKNTSGTVVSTKADIELVVEFGYSVDLNATFKWIADGNHKSPTSCSGDFGTTLPSSNVASAALVKSGLTANSQYRVTLTAPKNGLMVSGSTVVQATGNDNISATTKVTFVYVNYIGKVTVASPTESEIKALTSSQTYGRGKSVSGVTTSKTEYYCYAYPASLGDLTSIVQDGATPVLGAFNKTVVQVTTASGKKIDYNVYTSKNPGAFNNANLAFA